MPEFVDLTGKKFGKWTALKPMPNRAYWRCRCKCGAERIVSGANLRRGHSTSCGCNRRRKDAVRYHPLYPIWNGMMTRCRNPNAKDYSEYGGRGVKVCKRWHDFWKFVADMSPRPRNAQLHRPNDNPLYSPRTTVWASRGQQARDRRTSRCLTIKGKTKLIVEWAKETGISYHTLLARIDDHGWTPERAVSTPPRKYKPRKSK